MNRWTELRDGAPRTGSPIEAIVALGVALGLPLLVVWGLPAFVAGEIGTALGLTAMWILTAAVAFLTVRVERRGWSGLGVKRFRGTALLWGVGIGLALMLLVPALSLLGNLLWPTNGPDIASAANQPWQIVLLAVITAAITEEILFRSFPTERLSAPTGSPWPGAMLGLVAFTVLHAGNWNLAHVLFVVFPLGLLLTLVYVWRRSVLIVIVAHFITDLPLVVLAVTAQ